MTAPDTSAADHDALLSLQSPRTLPRICFRAGYGIVLCTQSLVMTVPTCSPYQCAGEIAFFEAVDDLNGAAMLRIFHEIENGTLNDEVMKVPISSSRMLTRRISGPSWLNYETLGATLNGLTSTSSFEIWMTKIG